MRCFYVLKKWSSAKLSLNRDLSLNKMSLNRDCNVLFELPYQGLRKVDGKMCAERSAASWVRFAQFLDLFVHFVRVWDKKWSKSDAITLWVDALCVSSSAILCTLLDSGGKLTSSITRFYTWGKNRGKVIFPCYVVIIIWLYIVRVVMVIEF